jgi:biopolymer transport protein ExbD
VASRRRAPPEDVEPTGFNMTPMIDCTFQLIIFFMLVTDMSRVQTEDLTLPSASKARLTEEAALVVNVMPDGKIRIAGRTFPDASLEGLFESRRAGAERGMGMPVLIRADRSTPFEHVQKVLMIASHHGAVTRIQFGAKQERSER